MPGLEHTHTLLATLGGQPQVVTFTLDLLLQRHIPIREVIVVHPASQPKLQHSIACLSAEFPGDRYKVDGRTIHFSITGGRRLMSFLSVSAALLNFEPADRLWHLYTPEAVAQRVRDGAIMHVRPEDGVRLIEVPFARLAQPILSHLLSSNHSDARTAISSQTEQTVTEDQERCKRVADEASPTELKVLRAFAKGLDPQGVAFLLERTLDTVSSHTNVLYGLCRNAWDIPKKVRVDYRFLQMKFANYFTDDE